MANDTIQENTENQAAAIQHPDFYISELHFNNDSSLPIKQNDIVVFVGPNNVGKSQCLRDIWNVSKDYPRGTVIKDISITKENDFDILKYFSNISLVKQNGRYLQYMGFGFSCVDIAINDGKNKLNKYGEIRDAFECFLQTDNRLSVCNAPDVIDRTEKPTHPIHRLVANPIIRDRVTQCFEKAFGCPIVPHLLHGKTVPMCLGEIPKTTCIGSGNAHELTEKYAELLETYPVLHEQGDGMRSFAGILLYLTVEQYRTFLIDEPESFLHPPQTVIIGKMIAELLSDKQQAFISTHSQHVIKGLLAEVPERVKIVRITRNGNQNSFSILDNTKIDELWGDPLLKHSEIMDGMFYNSVVVCESDADCRFYSIINSHLKEQTGTFSESLFVHCGGKHRMKKVVEALKSLEIDFRVIPDIDILNDESTIRDLVNACGKDWNTWQKDYNTIKSNLENVVNFTGAEFLQKAEEIVSDSNDEPLSSGHFKRIRKIANYQTKWSKIKESGLEGVPRGQAYSAMQNILDQLQDFKIFIVRCGELECFIKEVGGHGPEWLNNVLEQYPDLNNPVFARVKDFVSSWRI